MRHASTDSGKAAFMARAMVGAAVHKVNKNRTRPSAGALGKTGKKRRSGYTKPGLSGRLVFRFRQGRGVLYLWFIAIASVVVLAFAWLRARRLRQRENLIRALLDGADALEAQLQECRSRMQSLKEMLVALPEEMSERANTALSADDKVDAALKDLLAHRLWIQQNAETATSQQFEAARVALAQSSATLQAQLDRLAAISDDLQQARANAQSITPPAP